MPSPTPYTISGKCYDQDGTTALASVKVTAWSAKNNEWMPGPSTSTTNSLGEYTIDLANLPTAYANNDIVFIVAHDTVSNKKSLDIRHQIDTSVGSLEQDFVLHGGEAIFSECFVKSISATNTTAGGLRVDWYLRKNDIRIASLEVPVGDSRSFDFGEPGLKVEAGGIARVFESTTSGSLIATTTIDNS